ncbi:fimbrial protein [Serratia bockelmannii]|uniref:fimbrial protein n=1 Tax=Serratia bockelmannii TaxID=2703793 RepID=UPI003FA7624A
MKKCLLVLMTAACGLLGATQANAVGGTIQFFGSVNQGTCEVVGGDGFFRRVPLGDVDVGYFVNTGTKSQAVDFPLAVRNCPDAVKNVGLALIGQQLDDNPELFMNTAGTEGAVGVAVGVKNTAEDTVVIPNRQLPFIQVANNAATFNLQAFMESTQAAVTPGIVTAQATAVFTFKE